MKKLDYAELHEAVTVMLREVAASIQRNHGYRNCVRNDEVIL